MIYQISYKTDAYEKYFKHNEKYMSQINCTILRDDDIISFLKEYNYYDKFNTLNVHPQAQYAKTVILVDFFRLVLLYELGGIYIDADVYFTEKILTLEDDLTEKFGNRNITLVNNSLYFLKAIKKSPYMKYIVDIYMNSSSIAFSPDMLRTRNLLKYKDEMRIITHKTLKEYFDHENITTEMFVR